MIRWLSTVEEDGRVVHRIGRDVDGTLLAEWPGAAHLRATGAGAVVERWVRPDLPPRLRGRLLRGPMEALVRALRGEASLHGAAVARGGLAVGLLGDGGAGKSSFAAAACAHGGATLVADDVLHLGPGAPPRLRGGEAEHSLDEAACVAIGLRAEDADAGAKALVPAAVTEDVPLTALVQLAFAEGPATLVPLRGADALSAVLGQGARFALDDRAARRAELERAHALVQHVTVWRFTRPRDRDTLVAGVRRLLDELLPS